MQGFFTLYRNLFDQLAADEHSHGSDLEYPSFGTSEWSWQPIVKGGSCARDFYNYWSSFSTFKDFTWKEQWNLTEAPDRRVRRWDFGLKYTFPKLIQYFLVD
jgi:DnaJ family protein A protein 5